MNKATKATYSCVQVSIKEGTFINTQTLCCKQHVLRQQNNRMDRKLIQIIKLNHIRTYDGGETTFKYYIMGLQFGGSQTMHMHALCGT